MTIKQYPEDKLLNEKYAFYADVYKKKYNDKDEKYAKDLEYAHSLLKKSENDTEQFAYLSCLKKVCLEIEKQMHPYIKKEPNHYVYINEERLRLQDPLVDYLFAIKEQIEDKHYNKV